MVFGKSSYAYFNFTFQVVTDKDTQETLLCIAFVFEVSTSEHGAQHNIYRLVKDWYSDASCGSLELRWISIIYTNSSVLLIFLLNWYYDNVVEVLHSIHILFSTFFSFLFPFSKCCSNQYASKCCKFCIGFHLSYPGFIALRQLIQLYT